MFDFKSTCFARLMHPNEERIEYILKFSSLKFIVVCIFKTKHDNTSYTKTLEFRRCKLLEKRDWSWG